MFLAIGGSPGAIARTSPTDAANSPSVGAMRLALIGFPAAYIGFIALSACFTRLPAIFKGSQNLPLAYSGSPIDVE